MPNQTNSISALFERYINNECTPEEIATLLRHFEAGKDEDLLKQLIAIRLNAHIIAEAEIVNLIPYSLDNALIHIKQKIGSRAPRRIQYYLRYGAAAAIFLAVITITWLWWPLKETSPGPETSISILQNIKPGGDKAMLTLADGSVIVLDSAANGTLSRQGNSQILKLANGQLAYKSLQESITPDQNNISITQPITYNTIATPKGGQYQIILPDGSKIWLNAASSLRFPTNFAEKARSVELTGEAYFEIAQNPTVPFHVKASGTEVQVLGTSFNINSYQDESTIKTTLLEGSVQVVTELAEMLLKPGQQATVPSHSTTITKTTLSQEDIGDAVAWKNGMFVFNNADITTIMRQVSRWYDVEVKYQGAIPKDKFIGEVPRNSKITEVLKILELNNLNFRITDKTITVLP